MKAANFFLAGVGGQGILLAGNVLTLVGAQAGYDVKKSEIHGMSQRGGSVTSHVRWAEKVYSPMIGKGEADYLLALERLEGLRYLEYLRPGGVAILNDYSIPPIAVSIGQSSYPGTEQIRQLFAQVSERVYLLPAMQIAESLGNARTNNVVLLGALSTFLDAPAATWLEVIAERVPNKHVEINKQAFMRGRKALHGTI
jgi:indolepyruvate ferredoxin oxidoreductase beta subunit